MLCFVLLLFVVLKLCVVLLMLFVVLKLCITVIFMMHKLMFMSLIGTQQNTNPITYFKFFAVNTNTKGSFFSVHDKNEESPQLDALKRLTCLVMVLKDLVCL